MHMHASVQSVMPRLHSVRRRPRGARSTHRRCYATCAATNRCGPLAIPVSASAAARLRASGCRETMLATAATTPAAQRHSTVDKVVQDAAVDARERSVESAAQLCGASSDPASAECGRTATDGADGFSDDGQSRSSKASLAPEQRSGAAKVGLYAREVSAVRRLIVSGRYEDAERMLERMAQPLAKRARDVLRGEMLMRQGDMPHAIEMFLYLLKEDSHNIGALNGMSEVYRHMGDATSALQMLRSVLNVDPDNEQARARSADLLVTLGIEAKSCGRDSDALAHYSAALTMSENHSSALYNMGVLAHEGGRLKDAVALYRRAVRANDGDAKGWTNLGVLEKQLGNLEAASAALQRALALAPNDATVRFNAAGLHADLGAAAAAAGDAGAARAALERALALAPTHRDALFHLAALEASHGAHERALFLYESAVASAPRYASAWNNLGAVYQTLGNEERAMQCYEAAVEASPTFALALNNLGVLCTAQGRSTRAQRLFAAAIYSQPTYAEAHNNVGVLLRDMGLVREAIECYEECMRLCPESANAFQNRLLALNYVYGGEEEHVCRAHAEWGAAFQDRVVAMDAVEACEERRPRRGRRIRVAYLSPDLYRHSVSYFAEALLSGHSQESFQVFVYCCTPRLDSKSEYLKADAEASGATWRRVYGKSDRELAELIRSDRIDVLIELTGHTAHNRLGAMRYRPAPVQITYIGYPNSTGLPSIDYRLTDTICDPPDTKQTFVERLVRLDGCFLCYTPMRDPPPVASAPCLDAGHVTFGSFNALAKITDEVVQVWCRILHEVPSSRLILKNKPFACASTRDAWLKRFARHGIEAWRLELLALAPATYEHMEQYSCMDISLDPWPYAGTTTTCESLFMGVPCITMVGECHAHNVGHSLLTALDMQREWAAGTSDEYVEIAARWAARPAELAALRGVLRERMLRSRLCRADSFVAGLESCLQNLYQQWWDDTVAQDGENRVDRINERLVSVDTKQQA